MVTRIEAQAIREKVDLAALAGADVTLNEHPGGDYYYGPCPFCKEGDDRFKVFLNGDKGDYFYCRRCGKKGDAIQYTIFMDNVNFETATRQLQNAEPVKKVGELAKRSENGSKSVLEGELRAKWSDKLERLCTRAIFHLYNVKSAGAKHALDWLSLRGIEREDCIQHGLGFNNSWRQIIEGYRLPPGITIPRWQAHTVEVVACNVYLDQAARELTGRRRQFVKGSRAKVFWNDFKLPDDDIDTVVVCEGELDAILLSRYLPHFALAVATGGADTMPDELGLLRTRDIILAFDNDQAGMRATDRWLERIPGAVVAGLSEDVKDITDFWRAGGDLAAWIKEPMGWVTRPKATN